MEDRSFDIFDFLKILFKRKYILGGVFAVSIVTSYLLIRFLIPAEYDSTAMIISSEDNLTGLMKDLKNLPLGLGGKSQTGTQTDMFKTIIYSRTNLEKLIEKYNLAKDYPTDYKFELIETIAEKISIEDSESSFSITVRSIDKLKAVEMVNYIIDDLNKTVIEFNTRKSKSYREFMEKRYLEIRKNLAISEDNLTKFQKETGIIDKAEKQAELIVSNLVELEKSVILKQMELSIKEQTLSPDNPVLNDLKIELAEFKKELNNVKINGNPNSPILALNSLPDKIKDFVRYYRAVQTQNAIREYITPLYEHAKIE